MITHDILIIGGGLTGLSAVMKCDPDLSTAIISKVHPLRSHSVAAQGGINAAMGNNPEGKDDTWEKHAFDTIKGSDYLADQDAAELLCQEATSAIFELEHLGVPFSRFPDCVIAQRPFGGAGFPRTCYAADRTGQMILHTLYEQCLHKKVKFYDECLVTNLVVKDGKCLGVVAYDLATGRIIPFKARAVIFATGGYGRVYLRSTNAFINLGSGIGMAYRAGIPLKDMEFVQFHPTSLYGKNILITEGARGEGGYLLNNKGKRFMAEYASSAMELAPRDIVARAIQTEIDEGNGFENQYVHLDLRHLGKEKIMKRLPGIREICLYFGGLDPIDSPIPIQPAQHYSMGGIDVDKTCASQVEGFYAAGECACVSVHGANRLGGNSLLDAVVFGTITGETVSHFVKGSKERKDDEKTILHFLYQHPVFFFALLERFCGSFTLYRQSNRLRQEFYDVLIALFICLPGIVILNNQHADSLPFDFQRSAQQCFRWSADDFDFARLGKLVEGFPDGENRLSPPDDVFRYSLAEFSLSHRLITLINEVGKYQLIMLFFQ